MGDKPIRGADMVNDFAQQEAIKTTEKMPDASPKRVMALVKKTKPMETAERKFRRGAQEVYGLGGAGMVAADSLWRLRDLTRGVRMKMIGRALEKK